MTIAVGKMRGLPARVATAALVASLVLLSYPPSLIEDSGVRIANSAARNGLTDFLEAPAAGLTFFRDPGGRSPDYILADVAVDEEFVARNGVGWEMGALSVVADANALLVQVGIEIRVASTFQWRSDDGVRYISSHIRSAERQVQRASGHLLLAMMGQSTGKQDGWIEEEQARMIVQFYQDEPTRTHSLIAHEIGHLLGAEHHDDEVECTADGCIMDRGGHAHATTWCEHHERAVREMVSSKLPAGTF